MAGREKIKTNMNNLIECPVCSKKINKFVINEHVNECLNNDVDKPSKVDMQPVTENKKRKSSSPEGKGWGFMNSQGDRCQKRTKYKEDGLTAGKESPEKGTKALSECVRTETGSNVVSANRSNSTPSHNSDSTCPKIDLNSPVPLAELMRPRSIEEYIGQEKAVGESSMLRSLLQSDNIPSLLLWGPPGCGKTTLAKVISHRCKGKAKFVQLSATSSGVNDVKEVIKIAKNDLRMFKKRTILFLDEIHRFNKLQQDSLLPHVEEGTITLIGATTENPSFQVNNALLSRCRVVCLEKLDKEQLLLILKRATRRLGVLVIEEEKSGSDNNSNNGLEGSGVCIQHSALEFLSCMCDGDARQALGSLQLTVQAHASKGDNSGKTTVITSEHVKKGLEKSYIAYDKTGEEHYNCASALIKSMRGSDDSAALYWLARMLEGGETPLFVARRLAIFASEDVGLADTQALPLAVSTYQACHFLGMPECQINLAHCVVYLSRAPKSTESFEAYKKAKDCVLTHKGPLPPVPLHLRNAPTKLMKDIGYGKGYKYNPAHKTPVEQEYLPETLVGTNFFK